MGPPQGQMGNMGGSGMMFEPEMIGAIKIKDGLFIGDELASTVRIIILFHSCDTIGLRIRGSK
jgi:hypothetical protein